MRDRLDRATVVERFISQIAITPDGCWEWRGGRSGNGYGCGPDHWLTHRLMADLMYGALPDDIVVCHRCDNRACVRPSHLFIGTQADNLADMRAKGRDFPPPTLKGEQQGRSKLSDELVRQVRFWSRIGVTQRAIAKQVGVSQSTICAVCRHRTWTHVEQR